MPLSFKLRQFLITKRRVKRLIKLESICLRLCLAVLSRGRTFKNGKGKVETETKGRRTVNIMSGRKYCEINTADEPFTRRYF